MSDQRSTRRWRPGLIVAAVAVIALTISAIATGGFGITRPGPTGEAARAGASTAGSTTGSLSTSPGRTAASGPAPDADTGAGRSGPDADAAAASSTPMAPAEPDAEARCTGPAAGGMGVSDVGFDGGSVEVRIAEGQACFFDARQWWAADLSPGPVRTAQITGVGRIGAESATGQNTYARLLWGVAGPSVIAVSVRPGEGSGPGGDVYHITGPGSDNESGGFFLFQVPATGSMTVIATHDGTTTPVIPAPPQVASANGPDDPFVATYWSNDVGMDALLDGATIRVVDGCVTADGTTTLFFPRDQVDPATPPAVLRWNGTDYREGSTIRVGGGGGGAAGLPAGCPTDAWYVSPFQ